MKPQQAERVRQCKALVKQVIKNRNAALRCGMKAIELRRAADKYDRRRREKTDKAHGFAKDAAKQFSPDIYNEAWRQLDE